MAKGRKKDKSNDEGKPPMLNEVLSQRVLSFRLWRMSIESFDPSEIMKLQAAEEALERKASVLSVEASVSTRLTDEEKKALETLEQAHQASLKAKEEGGGKVSKLRAQSLVEVPLQPGTAKPAAEKTGEDAKKAPDDKEKEVKLKPRQYPGMDESAFQSVSLNQLPKGHVKDKKENFEPSTPKSSKSKGSMPSKDSIKKLL